MAETYVVREDWQAQKAQALVAPLRSPRRGLALANFQAALDMATDAIAEALHDAYLRGLKEGKAVKT